MPPAAPVQRLQSRNPANLEEVVATVDLATADEVVTEARRVSAAQRGWAAIPAPARGRVIAQVGRLVEANKDALAALVCREIGKTLAEARGEVQEVVDTCDFFLGEGRRLYGQTVPSEMPAKQLLTYRAPVGAAFIITAANFPTAVPSWYLVPALLAGNAVLWKPAETTPAIARALDALFHAGGVPQDVLRTVFADGATTSQALERCLEERLIQKVGFTGSTAVGRRIGELCGRYVQTPCLELGGKNPMVVMDDAELDLALEGALFSGFGTAGQRCTSLGTVWVHESRRAELESRLIAAVEAAVIGDPRQPVLYGPMISPAYLSAHEKNLELVASHQSVHGSTGIGRITSKNPRRGFIGDPDAGVFAHPTLVCGVKQGDALYETETFGPLVGLGTFRSLEQAVELANGHGYGLSASIYTRDPRTAWRFREASGAGMVSINNSTSGAEAHLPFGGNGKSGNGSRQSGIWVLDQFTRWQAVNWDWSGRLQKAQMDVAELPYQPGFTLG